MKVGITDSVLMELVFDSESLDIYRTVRGFMNGIGFELENYLAWKSKDMPGYDFVARKKNRPLQTDFIIDGVRWSIKNSKYGENSTTKDYRENYIGVTKHWCRVDTDGSYNWHNCPIPGCSEEEFRKWLDVKKPGVKLSSLCELF